MKTNKNNLPKKNASTKQGYYSCLNPEKYVGDKYKIIYRSSWEEKFMKYADTNSKVIAWVSEPEPGIGYVNPIDQKYHTYFPDFLIRVANEDGTYSDILVEVKPKAEYKEIPKEPAPDKRGIVTSKRKRNYMRALETYIVNRAKFDAAERFCAQRDKKFMIVDEDWF